MSGSTDRLVKGIIVSGALVLAACAPASVQPPAAPPAPAAAPAPAPGAPAVPAAPQPKNGGMLTYSPTTAPATLNPYIAAAANDEEALGVTYESLFSWRHDPGTDYRVKFEVVPWLAESWKQVDPVTYDVSLRKGVKWHDGVEFTADDVEWSLNYAIDPKNNLRARSRYFVQVAAVKALDRNTVRITATGPKPDFLSSLAERGAFILPKHVVDRGDDLRKVVVGTGPFKFKEFDPNSHIQHAKNPDYWQSGKPYVDGVKILYNMQAQHQDAAFIGGQIDILHRNDRKQLEQIQRQVPGLQFGKAIVQSGLGIIPKVDKKPLDDERVRKAIHLAVDRQGLNATATFGDGVINPPGMPGDKDGWAIPPDELLKLPGFRQPKEPDIAEAKRLLAEAGFANGLKLNLLYGTNLTLGVRIVEPLQAQLAQVGVQVELRPLPVAEATAEETKGQFDLLLNNTADHQFTFQFVYLYSKGAGYNGVSDPKLDDMLERMTRGIDEKERMKAGLEVQRYLLEKNYVIATIAPASFPMWQPWVFDYIYEPSNVTRLLRQQGYRIWMDVEKMPAGRKLG